MTAICFPTSPDVAQYMLQNVVHAVCDRPRDTAAQSDARGRDVEKAVNAFRPRDMVESMLAGLVVMHFHLIMDATHGAWLSQFGDPKARTTPGIVALGRAMTGFLRELRIAQNRPLEGEEAVPRESRGGRVAGVAAKPEVEAEKPREATPESSPTPAMSGHDAATAPPFRQRTEASVAAMLATGQPPVKPEVVKAGSKHVVTPPVGARASQYAGASAPENGLPGLPRMVGALRTAPEGLPIGRPRA